MGKSQRFPLAVQISNRDETTTKDARIVNGYVDIAEEKDFHVYKRPGTSVYASWAGAGQRGLGIYNWNGDLYAIFGTTLYKNGTSLGTVDGTATYTFTSCLGAIPSLVMQNGAAGYYYNTTSLLKPIPLNGAVSVIGSVTNASNVVTSVSPNTSALTIGQAVSGNGIPSGTTVTGIPSSTQFSMSNNATATYPSDYLVFNTPSMNGNLTNGSAVITGLPSTASLYVGQSVNGTNIPALAIIQSVDSGTQVTMNYPATGTGSSTLYFTTSFPSQQVKGVVYLDGYLNVMNTQAAIYSSEPNQPYAWLSGNYLYASIEADTGVALSKQLVYLLAFKKYSVEAFYDAGNPSGSPLGAVQGGKVSIGCRHADSIASMEGIVFWASQGRDGGISVHMMEGLKPSQVSTTAIDRLLQEADFTGKIYSWCAKIAGHRYYCLTIVNSNLTLVFDLTSKMWYQWTDINGNYLPFTSCSYENTNQALFQGENDGNLYKMEISNPTDSGAVIPFDLYTPLYDGGARTKKMINSIDFIADQQNGNILQIRCSDDDYQTWSNFRTVDLGQARPRLTNCGTFRKRAYHLRNRSVVALRIQFMEMDIEVGTL